jgi:hypothetical protein
VFRHTCHRKFSHTSIACFPLEALKDAPIAIIWEVTRAALFCDVDLRKFDLKYEAGNKWHDQSELRKQLVGHRDFVGKGLPTQVAQKTWDASLDSFKQNDEVVVLKAELEPADTSAWNLKLQPLTLSSGHRLDRRYGSDRFLELTIPDLSKEDTKSKNSRAALSSDKLMQWINQRHYFLGRLWEPFYVRQVTKKQVPGPRTEDIFQTKPGNKYMHQVYLFAVNGNTFRNPSPIGSLPPASEALTLRKRTNLSIAGLLEWAIGLSSNGSEPGPKYFSRLKLSMFGAL